MVHSRDDQEVGVAHEVKSPENQPQFSQMTKGQYWLGKIKPKQVLYQNICKIYWISTFIFPVWRKYNTAF